MKNKPEFLHFPDGHNYLSLLCYPWAAHSRSLYLLERGGWGGRSWRNVLLCQGFSHLSASLRHKAQQAHQFKPVPNEDNLHSCTAQKGLFVCPHLSSHICLRGHLRLRQSAICIFSSHEAKMPLSPGFDLPFSPHDQKIKINKKPRKESTVRHENWSHLLNDLSIILCYQQVTHNTAYAWCS